MAIPESKNNSLKGWKGLLLFILPYLIIVGFFQLVGFSVAGVDIVELDGHQSTSQMAISSLFGSVGTFLVVWLFTKGIYKESFNSLGFSIDDRGKEFMAGMLVGFFVMALSFYLLLILNQVNVETIAFDPTAIAWLFLLFVIVAIVEEVLFRGFVLGNLMASFHKYTALIVSALIFTVLHALNPNVSLFGLLNLFLAGILLGLPYIYTQNLWFPISLHFSWNFFQSVFGFHVSGMEVYSVIQISRTENNLLNGGEFGFEGSVLCTFLLISIILICYIYYKGGEEMTQMELV